MPRITVGRFARFAALLAAAVLGLALAAGASADTPPGRGPNGGPAPTPTPPGGDCAVLRVQLNGTQPATHTCLVPASTEQGTTASAVSSTTASSHCWSGDVKLHRDSYFSGPSICFTGEGWANLKDYYYYPWPWPNFVLSWNDKLSSFSTGQYYVNFYEHSFLYGAKLRYASYQSRSFMPSGWDDRVSSLCLWGPTVSCP
jgi:hypothetical protein